jgi:peptidoglycan/LPS O-acetylase OafA/YrhL
MGALRLLLASAVVLGHIEGIQYQATGGQTSVQCFYIISGFFIAMILDRKYNKKGDLKLFYSNRLIRIFSVYWFFLAIAAGLAVVWRLTSHRGPLALLIENRRLIGIKGMVFLAFSNVFVLGQDWALFLKVQPPHVGLQWTTNFLDSDPVVNRMLLVPPAWSLGIELTFYAVAPLFTRARWWGLGALIGASLLLRFFFHLRGLDSDPWSYRFFPFEIALFLAGALSYRVYRKMEGRMKGPAWRLLAVGIFPLILAFPFYDDSRGFFFSTGRLILYAYLVIALPALFEWTGRVKIDRALGEASYPLYLCHAMVLNVVEHFSRHAPDRWMVVAAVLGTSLGVAFLTARYLDEPIDRFRQLRVRREHAVF